MTKQIDKDVVCLMPWMHMHIWPNGNALPCCMSDSNVVFGNVHKEKINDLINNDNYKKIRLDMLNGIKPEVCSRCYELETSADSFTLRKNSLSSFKEHLHLLEETNEDNLNCPVIDGFDNIKGLKDKNIEINHLVSDILNDSSIGLLQKSTINVLNLNKTDKLPEIDDINSDLDSIDSDISINSNYSFTLDK